MTPKECVKAALQGKETPYIPYGEYAIDSDTVERLLGHETYLRAKAKCQLAFWEGRRDEVVQSWKEDTVALVNKIGLLDLVNMTGEASGIVPSKDERPICPKKIDDATWEDRNGCIYRYSPVTRDITMIFDPRAESAEFSPEDFANRAFQKPDDSVFEVIDYVTAQLGGRYFIVGPAGREGSMIFLGGMERGFMEYLQNPEAVEAAMEQEVALADFEDAFYLRPGVDAVLWGIDFSCNSGPMISPALFRKLVLPFAQKRVAKIHSLGLPVIKHACGNNQALLDMFCEIGYDCYQSIQTLPCFPLAQLKKDYGAKLCLWGGVPLESIIAGTRQEVRSAVREAVKTLSPGGGAILGSSHSIAVGSNYDNYMAMLDEISKLR